MPEDNPSPARRLDAAERYLMNGRELPYLSQLTLGLLHRFNNVITGAVFTTEECVGDASVNAEMRERLVTIASSLREALTFTNRVVGLHTSHHEDDTSYYDLQKIVEAALVLLRFLVPKRAAIDFIRSPEKIVCYASRRGIEEILLHLVGNAGEAIAPGSGAVLIEVRQDTATEEPRAEVVIRDNGAGLAPGMIERIFEPFTTSKINRNAAGMGLFRARECARAMGGELVARNHPDGGAEFVLSLPQASG